MIHSSHERTRSRVELRGNSSYGQFLDMYYMGCSPDFCGYGAQRCGGEHNRIVFSEEIFVLGASPIGDTNFSNLLWADKGKPAETIVKMPESAAIRSQFIMKDQTHFCSLVNKVFQKRSCLDHARFKSL